MDICISVIILLGGQHKAAISGICALQRTTVVSKEQMYWCSIYGNYNIEFRDLLIKWTIKCKQFTVTFLSNLSLLLSLNADRLCVFSQYGYGYRDKFLSKPDVFYSRHFVYIQPFVQQEYVHFISKLPQGHVDSKNALCRNAYITLANT